MGELGSDPGNTCLSAEEIELLLSGDEKGSVPWLDQKPTFLFFSANWCRPCKNFTKVLIDIYRALKSTERQFEVIFVSLDRDKASFTEYSGRMPWLVLPFDPRISRRLCEHYKVGHIPSLILWSSDSHVVEEDIVRFVDDYGVDAFPFTRKRREQLEAMDETSRLGTGSLQALLGSPERDYLVSGEGTTKIPISELNGKTIGLYFGGHWSPPCRSFTHQLLDVYEELDVSEPGKFEVVFVSSDSNEDEFDQNTGSMPWPSIPYKDRSLKNLSRIFLVNRIPALVLIGPDGKTLSTNGRNLITCHGAKAFPFTEKKIGELEGQLEKEREGLPQQVSDPKHQHELKLDRAMAYVCDGCTRPGRFWVFSCNTCNFDLHPHCVQCSPSFAILK